MHELFDKFKVGPRTHDSSIEISTTPFGPTSLHYMLFASICFAQLRNSSSLESLWRREISWESEHSGHGAAFDIFFLTLTLTTQQRIGKKKNLPSVHVDNIEEHQSTNIKQQVPTLIFLWLGWAIVCLRMCPAKICLSASYMRNTPRICQANGFVQARFHGFHGRSYLKCKKGQKTQSDS